MMGGRGVQGVFLGQRFFWVYERCGDFFGLQKTQGFLLGIALYIS